MDLIQSCQNLKSYLKSSDVKNNLDPGRATMVVVSQELEVLSLNQPYSLIIKSSQCHYV